MDHRENVTWYRKAVEQRDAKAQFNLAADQGQVDAAKSKGIVEEHMTSSQIAQAQSLSTAIVRPIGGGKH